MKLKQNGSVYQVFCLLSCVFTVVAARDISVYVCDCMYYSAPHKSIKPNSFIDHIVTAIQFTVLVAYLLQLYSFFHLFYIYFIILLFMFALSFFSFFIQYFTLSCSRLIDWLIDWEWSKAKTCRTKQDGVIQSPFTTLGQETRRGGLKARELSTGGVRTLLIRNRWALPIT